MNDHEGRSYAANRSGAGTAAAARVRVVGILASALLLTGCAVAAKVEARNDYRASAEQYKQCLVVNPSSPQQCEGLRLAMEADERKYNNFGAGMTPGAQQSGSYSILNR